MHPVDRMSRRRFLGIAGGVAGGAVLLAACGGGDDDSATSDTSGTGATLDHSDHEFSDLSPGVLSGDLYVSDQPQRFAFAMLAKEGFASGETVRLAVAPEGSVPSDFVDTTLHTEGLPERRGVYVAQLAFPSAGVWNGLVDRAGERIEFAFQVHEAAQAPTIGSAAPTAASPTTSATLGVDPICTHDPPCSLHDTSLDTLVGKGRPVAVLFATPARCTSQYCGPVLDSLLPLVDEYAADIDIVHVDIYENNESDRANATVTAWQLPSEPWFFGVDADGTVTARLDGAFAQTEMRAVLDALRPA